VGLFGYVQGAYLHDLTLELANTADEPVAYTGTGGASPEMYIGGLVGSAQGSRIEDIKLQAKPGAGLYVSSIGAVNAGGAVGKAAGTVLFNSTSTIPLNIEEATGTITSLYAGGIAGNLDTGEVSSSTMRGNITIESAGLTTKSVGGIVGNIVKNGTLKNNTADFGTLKVHTNLETTGAAGAIYAGGITGNGGTIQGCVAKFVTLEIAPEGLAVSSIRAGGLGGATAGIENSRAQFTDIKIAADTDTSHLQNVMVGGLAGQITTGSIQNSYLEGRGSIQVTALNRTYTTAFFVGGLAGQGDVSRSRIPAGIAIAVESGGGTISAGGLTGNGVAAYSFIGTPDSHATVSVKKTNTTNGAQNFAYVGGISGQATVTAAKLYQYNYAFCDVSLETVGAGGTGTATTASQSAGGLVGYLAGTAGSCTQNYAAGSVLITNNYGGNENTVRFNAGGIAGSTNSNVNLTISQCAALNGSVEIKGTNTTASNNVKGIAYPGAGNSATFTNNITTLDIGIADGANTADGLKVASTNESTFTQTLQWDFDDTWEWNNGIGLPVLKAQVFEDEA
jgi:hypothetical protein